MMAQKNLLITESKYNVLKIQYLLVRYVYGFKLTYFRIKSNFVLKVRLTCKCSYAYSKTNT